MRSRGLGDRSQRGDRVAHAVQQHVGGIEVDSNTRIASGLGLYSCIDVGEDIEQGRGTLLASFEAQRDAVAREEAGQDAESLDQHAAERIGAIVRHEPGVERDQAQAQFAREACVHASAVEVGCPVAIRDDAAGLANGRERCVVFADGRHHPRDDADAGVGERLASASDVPGAVGVVACVDERTKGELDGSHAGGAELCDQILGGGWFEGPGADGERGHGEVLRAYSNERRG